MLSPATVRFVGVRDPSRPKAPYVAIDGNGNEVKSWDVRTMAFIREHLNEPLQVETTTKQNGRFTDIYLEKAELPTPPSPNGSSNGWHRDPAESRLIVRQSCLKAAVDYGAYAELKSTKEVLAVAETFVAWAYGQVRTGAVAPVSVAAKVGPTRRLSDGR